MTMLDTRTSGRNGPTLRPSILDRKPQVVGTARTTNGPHYEAIDLSGVSPDPKLRFLYRTGIAVQAVTSANASGRVRLIQTCNTKQKHLGGRTLQITHGSTGRVYMPLGLTTPAQAIDKLRAGFVVTGSSGLKYGLAYRPINDPLNPDPWALWESALTTSGANERRCTGDLAVPAGGVLTNKLLVELGLAIEAASTVCHGQVSTAVTAKEL